MVLICDKQQSVSYNQVYRSDMNNPRLSKRKQTIIRLLNYALMTAAVLVLSVICIFLILGYQFNTQKGTIDQGGLIQFRSFPSGARIVFDGQPLGFQTPGKQNVAAGTHTTTMQLAGYHDWSKTIPVKPGELRWLNYARFIPKNIITRQVAVLPSLGSALASPDRQWLAVISDNNNPVVTVYDLRNEAKITSAQLTLPASALLTAPAAGGQTFSLVEWDFGGRFLLIKRTVADSVEFIRVERSDPKTAVNITELFHLPFSVMHFSGTSGNSFYGLNGTDLRYIDAASKTVSLPLVEKVKQFRLYKEKDIAYISADNDTQTVGMMRDSKKTIVRTYPASDKVMVDLSSFSNNDYMAVVRNSQLEILKDPLDNADSAGRSFASMKLELPQVGWVDFSNNGRFVVVGSGTGFETYDIETDDVFVASLQGQAASDVPLKWLDDYYLTSSATGSVELAEFDGRNSHLITSALPGLAVTLSDNGNYLYSFSKSDAGYILQQSRLNLAAN